MYKQFRGKIDHTEAKLSGLQKAEDEYYLTTKCILELANRAYELFTSSEVEQRRQLIMLTLQNLTIKGRIVRYDAQKPFDTILNFADNQLWLPTPKLSMQGNTVPINEGFERIIEVFENVSYMGELRQRWVEIKKLLKRGMPESLPATIRTV